LKSNSGMYCLIMGYDGKITVMNNMNRMIQFQIGNFLRPVTPPYFLRLEPTGELVAVDAA